MIDSTNQPKGSIKMSDANEFFLILFFAFAGLIVLAYWIAAAITHVCSLGDRQRAAEIEQRSTKHRAAMAAEQAAHDKLIAKAKAETAAIKAKLDQMKTDPRWIQLQNEINSEHTAMIKGRQRLAAMRNS